MERTINKIKIDGIIEPKLVMDEEICDSFTLLNGAVVTRIMTNCTRL